MDIVIHPTGGLAYVTDIDDDRIINQGSWVEVEMYDGSGIKDVESYLLEVITS